nr:MAG TPA: hypothetical protein [Caudoviricetes sp.]
MKQAKTTLYLYLLSISIILLLSLKRARAYTRERGSKRRNSKNKPFSRLHENGRSRGNRQNAAACKPIESKNKLPQQGRHQP